MHELHSRRGCVLQCFPCPRRPLSSLTSQILPNHSLGMVLRSRSGRSGFTRPGCGGLCRSLVGTGQPCRPLLGAAISLTHSKHVAHLFSLGRSRRRARPYDDDPDGFVGGDCMDGLHGRTHGLKTTDATHRPYSFCPLSFALPTLASHISPFLPPVAHRQRQWTTSGAHYRGDGRRRPRLRRWRGP